MVQNIYTRALRSAHTMAPLKIITSNNMNSIVLILKTLKSSTMAVSNGSDGYLWKMKNAVNAPNI